MGMARTNSFFTRSGPSAAAPYAAEAPQSCPMTMASSGAERVNQRKGIARQRLLVGVAIRDLRWGGSRA